jgi:hypothetical protein
MHFRILNEFLEIYNWKKSKSEKRENEWIVLGQNLAHGLATPAKPSGERLVSRPMPVAPRGSGHHVVREVADGEPAAQVSSGLHHRAEGWAWGGVGQVHGGDSSPERWGGVERQSWLSAAASHRRWVRRRPTTMPCTSKRWRRMRRVRIRRVGGTGAWCSPREEGSQWLRL